MVWTQQEPKKIYIWVEYTSPFTPWANTVAYYPLTSSTTVNNQVSGGTNLTNSNVVFWVANGVDCATISGNSTTSNHGPSSYLYNNLFLGRNR